MDKNTTALENFTYRNSLPVSRWLISSCQSVILVICHTKKLDCSYILEVILFIPPSVGSSSSLGDGTAFSSEAKDSTTKGASRNFNN